MIVSKIPANTPHYAQIYEPSEAVNTEMVDRYRIMLPRTDEFDRCRVNRSGGINASSKKPPVIMIGNGHFDEQHAWDNLCDKARRWRIPLNVLLTNRPLDVACELWTPRNQFSSGAMAVELHAVRIGGDFSKSDALDERIAQIKAMFE